MSTGTEQSTRADNKLGVYTLYDEDGNRHGDKQLEAQAGPQADALVRMGYRFDQAATDTANAARAEQEGSDTQTADQSANVEEDAGEDAPKRGRRG